MASGAGLYLSGERPCCETLNASDQTLLRKVLTNQDVIVGSQGDIAGPYTFNPDVTDYITQVPNTLTDFQPVAPGGMQGLGGVSSRNVLASNGTDVVGGAWSEQDMKDGRGRIALLMDVNWTDPQYNQHATIDPIVENLAAFLANGLARTEPGAFGYEFANEGMQGSFATHAGLGRDTVVTDTVIGRTFADLHSLVLNGYSIRNHAETFWNEMNLGTCFGMALSGGRFESGIDTLADAADGRADGVWNAADENDLPAPDSDTSTHPAYTKELLQLRAEDFIAQNSFEFDASNDAQRAALAASSDPVGLLADHITDVMRNGTDGDYSTLTSAAGTKLALIALQTPHGGHAVVAYGLRRHPDGSVSIDVWDNNHPGQPETIEVNSDGSWSYGAGLNWSGSPRATGGAQGFVTAYPLFRPRALHYLSSGGGGPKSPIAIADVPAGTTIANDDGIDLSPVMTDAGEDAGAWKAFSTAAGSLALGGDKPAATVRGEGIAATIERASGTGFLTGSFDVAAGTISAYGAPALLSVERDGRQYQSTGASRLTVAPDGTVTTDPDGSGPVTVIGPDGTVIQSSGPTAGSGGSSGPSQHGSPTPTPTPTPTPAAPPPSGVHAGGTAQVGQANISGTTASVTLRCTGSERSSCIVKLTLTATEIIKRGKVIAITANSTKTKRKVVVFGTATVTIATGHSKTAKVSLNGNGKRLLSKHHTLKAKLAITQLGLGRTTRIGTKMVTFKATRKTKHKQ